SIDTAACGESPIPVTTLGLSRLPGCGAPPECETPGYRRARSLRRAILEVTINAQSHLSPNPAYSSRRFSEKHLETGSSPHCSFVNFVPRLGCRRCTSPRALQIYPSLPHCQRSGTRYSPAHGTAIPSNIK